MHEPEQRGQYFAALINLAIAVTSASRILVLFNERALSVQVAHGDIQGTLTLMGSNDKQYFFPVQGVEFAAINGPGGEIVEIQDMGSRYYRLDYAHLTGIGFLKVAGYSKAL